MNSLKEMRAELLALEKTASDFHTKIEAAEKTDEGAGEDLTKGFDDAMTAMETKTADIKRMEAALARGDRWQRIQDRLNDTKSATHRLQTEVNPDGAPQKVVIPATAFRARKHDKLLFSSEEQAYSFGRYCMATLYHHDSSKQWCQDHGIIYGATLSGKNNAGGGVLIPDQFMASIIELVETYGVYRNFADEAPMTSDTLIWPRLTTDMVAFIVGESDDPTQSDPAWDSVNLFAKKAVAMTVIPEEVSEDAAINVAQKIGESAARAFAFLEDTIGFVGTGTQAQGGIIGLTTLLNDGNYAGTVYTALTGNTAFSTLDLADFEAMVGKLPLYARAGARWYISPPGFAASMGRLMDAGGGNTITDLANGVRPQFLGYQVSETLVMNSTLTAQTSTDGIVLFGNLAQSGIFGNRRQFALASDAGGKYFDKGQIAMKGTSRFDITNHTVANATTAGAMITMSTPSS